MVDVWTNGKLDLRVRYAAADMMASYLSGKGWGVRWLPDIGVLALWSPEEAK